MITKEKNIYMLGIAGISMSGIAMYLKSKGYHVSGSNDVERLQIDRLRKNGITVNIGKEIDNITKEIDIVIRSSAIKDENIELQSAKEKGIQILKRAEFLGKLTEQGFNIGVMGAHGKTTTTGIIGSILKTAGINPSVFVGGEFSQFEYSNVEIGREDLNVIEICEYDRSLLNFKCNILGFTNVDYNHPDCYSSLSDVITTYNKFLNQNFRNNMLVLSEKVKKYVENIEKYNVLVVGENSDCDVIIHDLTYQEEFTKFNILYNGKVESYETPLLGESGLIDSVIAIVICRHLNVDYEVVKNSLKEYQNAKFRMDYIGRTNNGIKVYDDYAHVPEEIIATIKAFNQKYPKRRIWCVFQPKQFHRTRLLMEEYINAFQMLDVERVIITKAEKGLGDEIEMDYTIDMEFEQQAKGKEKIIFKNDKEEVFLYLIDHYKSIDIIITLGSSYEIRIMGEEIISQINAFF